MLDSEQPSDAGIGPGEQGIIGVAETTGRFIVVFAEEDGRTDSAGAERILRSLTGVSNIASAQDFTDAAPGDFSQLDAADATLIPDLGVAIVTMDPAAAGGLQAAESSDGRVLIVEPELVHHVLAPTATDYLSGYQDAVIDLTHRLGGQPAGAAATTRPVVTETFADTEQLTWGLQATGVASSPHTGAGVKVAVLDTGFDLTHPDFAGRAIQSKSFVAGQAVQDEHGHGTHCVGTSCGPRSPAGTRRYGCAPEAEIYVGKVLSNGGSGTDSGILLGIDWALSNGCDVVSMSLGADVATVSKTYEAVGSRALRRKCLIVAAAGNNAHRPSDPGFVGVPANSPSHRGGRRSRLPALGRSLLGAHQLGPWRSGRHRRPRCRRLLVLADVQGPLPLHQRHQHGDPARGRDRRAVGRGDRSDRAGPVVHGDRGGPTTADPLGRRGRGVGPGAAVTEPPGVASGDVEQLTVAVDDDHLAGISDVVAALEGRGMVVDQVLESAGVIIGSAPDVDRQELAAVEGVVSVEGETPFQLPPPDAPVQ